MTRRRPACCWVLLGCLLVFAAPARAKDGPAAKPPPASARSYVLRYRANYTCTYPQGGSDVVTASGSIPFKVAPGGGAVSARGTFRHVGSGYVFAGPLVLEGKAREGVLHFPFPAGYSGGQRVYNRTDALKLALKDGATINVPHIPVPGTACQGEVRFTIEKPLDRWKVTVDDHLVAFGIHEGLASKARRAGLSLHVRREVEVSVERGRFKEGHGTARYVSIRSYSNPPWAYKVKAAVTWVRGTGTDIEAERFDQAHWAKRFHPPKTKADAALKKAWESIKKTRTPAIIPSSYAVQGTLSGSTLDLRFPDPFACTVALYGKLDVAAVEKRGFHVADSTRREFIDLVRSLLAPRMNVQLQHGWRHECVQEKKMRRTAVLVERIE